MNIKAPHTALQRLLKTSLLCLLALTACQRKAVTVEITLPEKHAP